MAKFDMETIFRYEKVLKKDPKSKIFAALADAYREVGRVEDAESIATKGIQNHPDYVAGYVALGRILCQKDDFEAALPVLEKSIELAPENLLAYQLLGQAFLELKRPQDALRAHKMALFLNPLSERSRLAVQKLEALTSVDFPEDLFKVSDFKMGKIPSLSESQMPSNDSSRSAQKSHESKNSQTVHSSISKGSLERDLSFIDALIIRNELDKAQKHLMNMKDQWPDSEEIDERWTLVFGEEGPPILPPISRKKESLNRKIKLLNGLLYQVRQARGRL